MRKGTTPARTTNPPAPTRRPLGVILAGGASRRFGSPKTRARVGGVPLVRRVADALTAAGLPLVTIVASADQPLPFHAPSRGDEIPGAGPLGGIAAALSWAREQDRPGAVCVACDLPFVAAGLLRHLAARGVGSGARALVPAGGGRWGFEPLCAYYSCSALPTVRRRAFAGELRLGALLAELGARVVPPTTVRRWGDPEVLFLNVNTPGDRRRAERFLRQAHA